MTNVLIIPNNRITPAVTNPTRTATPQGCRTSQKRYESEPRIRSSMSVVSCSRPSPVALPTLPASLQYVLPLAASNQILSVENKQIISSLQTTAWQPGHKSAQQFSYLDIMNRQHHWNSIYKTKTSEQLSWTQEVPATSLDFVHSSCSARLNEPDTRPLFQCRQPRIPAKKSSPNSSGDNQLKRGFLIPGLLHNVGNLVLGNLISSLADLGSKLIIGSIYRGSPRCALRHTLPQSGIGHTRPLQNMPPQVCRKGHVIRVWRRLSLPEGVPLRKEPLRRLFLLLIIKQRKIECIRTTNGNAKKGQHRQRIHGLLPAEACSQDHFQIACRYLTWSTLQLFQKPENSL